jgi:hypothetical protein
MNTLSPPIISSFKSALNKMTGHTRRLFAAELANIYFDGSARKTERVLGISRDMIELGLRELQIGIRCLENFSQRGRKKEFKFGSLSADIDDIVSLNTQSERCHNDTKGYIKATTHQVTTALMTQKGYILPDFCLSTVNKCQDKIN